MLSRDYVIRGFYATVLYVGAVCFFKRESSYEIQEQIKTHNLSFWIPIGAVTTAKYRDESVICFSAWEG